MQNVRRIGPPISRGRQISHEFFFSVVLGVHHTLNDTHRFYSIHIHSLPLQLHNLYFKSDGVIVIIIAIRPTVIYVGPIAIWPNAVTCGHSTSKNGLIKCSSFNIILDFSLP